MNATMQRIILTRKKTNQWTHYCWNENKKHLILYYMIHANIKYTYKRTVLHVSISDINECKSYIAVVR